MTRVLDFGNFATGNSEAFITGASYRSYLPSGFPDVQFTETSLYGIFPSVFPDVQFTETSLYGIFPAGFPEVLITGSFSPNFPEKTNYV